VTRVRVPIAARLTDGARLRFTVDEANDLALPLTDQIVAVWGEGRELASHWCARTLQLTIPATSGLVDHSEFEASRADRGELLLQPVEPRRARSQASIPTTGAVRNALRRRRFSSPPLLELARDVAMHRADPAYGSRRLAQPTPVEPIGLASLEDQLIEATSLPHALIAAPLPVRRLVAVRTLIERLASDRCDRVYLALPPESEDEWQRCLNEFVHLLPAGTPRTSISFLDYKRLPSWRPARTGRALLVVDAAEHATRRWPGRLGSVLGRASASIVAGTSGYDGIGPAWAEHLLASFESEARLLVFGNAPEAVLQAWRYQPTLEELRWRATLGRDGSAEYAAPLWAPWGGDELALVARLEAVVECCSSALQEGRGVGLRVSSDTAAAQLRELCTQRGHSVTTGARGGAPPQVTLLRPGDPAPSHPAGVTVHADLGAIVADPHLQGHHVFTLAKGTGEEVFFDRFARLQTAAADAGLTVEELLPVAVRSQWRELASSVLAGACDGGVLVNGAPRWAHRARRRRERLSGVATGPASSPSLPRTGEGGLAPRHVQLVRAVLESQGSELAHLRAGSSTLRVIAGDAGPTTPPPGASVVVDPQEEQGQDVVQLVAAPGTPTAERLFGTVSRSRVSVNVAALSTLAEIPPSVHASRLKLIDRAYRRPQTAEAVGDFLSVDGGSPRVRRVHLGDAEVHGRQRRSLVTGDTDELGLPDEAVLLSLLEKLEEEADTDESLLSAMFTAGDDVDLVERWRREDGVEITTSCPVPKVGAPVHTDARGSTIRVLDCCDGGHLVDTRHILICSRCHTERCVACPGGLEDLACRFCGADGCPGCVLKGLCETCRNPQRIPQRDTAGLCGWRVADAVVLVGDRSVTVERSGVGPGETYVLDGDIGDEFRDRQRALALAHGLPPDAPIVRAPTPRRSTHRGLFRRERDGGEWVVRTALPAGCIEATDPSLLPASAGPAVRRLSSIGLDLGWIHARHRVAPISVVTALMWLPYRDLAILTIESDGLRWKVTRRFGDGVSETLEERRIDLQAPASPRDDTDGRLLGVGQVVDLSVELFAVNTSYVLRIHCYGETLEWFVPGASGVTHGSELAWHAIARGYGMAPGTPIVAALPPLDHRTPLEFATPTAAELVERTVAPFATFSAAPERHRPVDADDLAVLRRREVRRDSTEMPREAADRVRALVLTLRPEPVTPVAVSASFALMEEWRGVGSRIISYTADGSFPAWPTLDDSGEPAPDFGVDSEGHLHWPGSGRCCEACDRLYCRVCPPETEFGPCNACGQEACGMCLTKAGVGPSTVAARCPRCDRESCGSCGRDVDLRPCSSCLRELCRWCVPDPSGACPTCFNLADGSEVELPSWIPTAGCKVVAAEDVDARIVVIIGAQRRETLVLRNGEVSQWWSFHPDVRVVCAAVCASRRWERDWRVEAEPRIQGPLHSTTDATIWADRYTMLEVGPRGSSVQVGLDPGVDVLDAIAAALDDHGPVPVPAATGRVTDGTPPAGNVAAPRSRPLRLLQRVSLQSVEVGPQGLTVSTDEWVDGRGKVHREHVDWSPRSTEGGRHLFAAETGAVSCQVLCAGSDVELHIKNPKGEKRIAAQSDQLDLWSAKVAHHASWDGPDVSWVAAIASPETAQPLDVVGDHVTDRRYVMRARRSELSEACDLEGLLAHAKHVGIDPPPPRDVDVDGHLAALAARFAVPPATTVELGMRIWERFAGGTVLEYEIWPRPEGVRYEHAGRDVSQLVIDSAGHVVTAVETCAYCAQTTCQGCPANSLPCVICAISVCGRCSPVSGQRTCAACRRLTPVSIRAGRKVFEAPRPWRFIRGTDVRHEVTIGRTRAGFRVSSRGTHTEAPPLVHHSSNAGVYLQRLFDRR
jgi:hypothetical protein